MIQIATNGAAEAEKKLVWIWMKCFAQVKQFHHCSDLRNAGRVRSKLWRVNMRRQRDFGGDALAGARADITIRLKSCAETAWLGPGMGKATDNH